MYVQKSSFIHVRHAATLVEMVVTVAIITVVAGLGFTTWRAGTRAAAGLDEMVDVAANKVAPKSSARAPRFLNGPQANGANNQFLASPFLQVAGAPAASPVAAAPAAGTLLGVTNTELIAIDTATANYTTIGKLGVSSAVMGLDYRAGNLYVMGEGPNNLFNIDPSTGALIGSPITIAGGGGMLEGDLAFRSDGIGFVVTAFGNDMKTFDLSAPVPTYISLGAGVAPTGEGLAFNSSGVLYFLGRDLSGKEIQVYTLDQTTGVKTPLPNTTGLPIRTGSGTGGLAYDSSGNLYGCLSYGSPSYLYKIDPVSGIATTIGQIGNFWVRAIRFVPGGGGNGTGGPSRPPVRRPTPPRPSTNRRTMSRG